MSIREVDAGEWDKEVLESKVLTVVDFWHEHCPWCIRLEPVLNEVAQEYGGGVKFVKLNVLKNVKNREIAIRYGIMSTPTLLFFCKGRPVEGVIGFMSKEKLKEILENVLERHEECIRHSTELKI